MSIIIKSHSGIFSTLHRACFRNLGQQPILPRKDTFYERSQKFHPFTPHSIYFLIALDQNKALLNLQKGAAFDSWTQYRSRICSAVPTYLQPSHSLSTSIFRTGSLFKTLRNVDQIYSQPFHRALLSHIQVYSEPHAKLAYAETWYIQNPGIFRTSIITIQNPVIFL